MNDINNLIKNRRIELGLTQLDIAKATGVTEATVSRWESGQISNMRRSKIAALAKALKLSPSTLMGLEPDYAPSSSLPRPAPVSEDEPLINIVKIAGRDGSYMEKQLGDKELQTLKSFIDLLPDASDDL